MFGAWTVNHGFGDDLMEAGVRYLIGYLSANYPFYLFWSSWLVTILNGFLRKSNTSE
jgi:hypothetical protein